MKIFKKFLIVIGIVLFLGIGIYNVLFKVSDEIGFLGAGKVGRQVLIQSMDNKLMPDISVESEFLDHNLFYRIIVGEPTRTTIRFNIQNQSNLEISENLVREQLNQPHQIITDSFQGEIVMQEDFEIDVNDFRELMKKKNVVTLEDLYEGYGFKKYEVYINGSPKVTIEFKDTKNTIHVGN